MTATNVVCGTVNSGSPYYAPVYSADLVITGPPGDTVDVKTTVALSWWPDIGSWEYDWGNVQIGTDGTVTKNVTSYGFYFPITSTASATDATNPGTATVQICPQQD